MHRLLGALLVAGCLGGTGTSSAAPVVQLTMEDFVRAVDAANPTLRMALSAQRSEAARRVGAGLWLPSNPQLSGGAGFRKDTSGSTPPATGVEWQVRLEQAFEVGNQRTYRLDETDAHVRLAQLRVQVARTEVRARAQAAYVAAQLAQAQMELARERRILARDLLHSAEQRVTAGAANSLELELARAELGRAEASGGEDSLQLRQSQWTLAALAAMDPRHTLQVVASLGEPVASNFDVEDLLETAEARRPELAVLAQSRDSLDLSLRRLQREVIPNLSVYLEYQSQQPGQHYTGAGLGIGLPVYRQNQGELALVQAQQEALLDEKAVTQQNLRLQVVAAEETLVARREIYLHWEQQVVPAALQHVSMSIAGWKAGKWDFRSVVQSLRDSSDALRLRLAALGALWSAHIELERAIGGWDAAAVR